MPVIAKAKEVKMSARKVGVVASLVRGRSVNDAITILEHTPRRAAKPLSKVIASAKANAENNHGYQADSLVITAIEVGPGSSMKRYRPAAHGRALPYKKHSTNIRVEVDGVKKPEKKKSSVKKPADKPTKAEKSDKETK